MVELNSQRLDHKMKTDRGALDELFASTILAHIGLTIDGRSIVFPTGFAVVDDRIVIHGSSGSRWMRAIEGQDASVAVTKLDAVVVARSTFESSMQYRSAMLFGRFERVEGEQKRSYVDELSNRMIPGRVSEVRPSSKKELAATTVLAMPITEWSLRVSEDWPDDEDDDIAGDAWAGIVRFGAPSAAIVASPDLREGIAVPQSVHELAAHPERFV